MLSSPSPKALKPFNSPKAEGADRKYRIPSGKILATNPLWRQKAHWCLWIPTSDKLYRSFLFPEKSCACRMSQPLIWTSFLLVLISDCPIPAEIYVLRGLLPLGSGKTANALSLVAISQLTRPPSKKDSLAQKWWIPRVSTMPIWDN